MSLKMPWKLASFACVFACMAATTTGCGGHKTKGISERSDYHSDYRPQQLSDLPESEEIYFANSGGRDEYEVTDKLNSALSMTADTVGVTAQANRNLAVVSLAGPLRGSRQVRGGALVYLPQSSQEQVAQGSQDQVDFYAEAEQPPQPEVSGRERMYMSARQRYAGGRAPLNIGTAGPYGQQNGQQNGQYAQATSGVPVYSDQASYGEAMRFARENAHADLRLIDQTSKVDFNNKQRQIQLLRDEENLLRQKQNRRNQQTNQWFRNIRQARSFWR